MSVIQEFLRYQKQVMLPEIGVQGQEKIKNAKVIVIGAGGLGCPILQYLTLAGVGTIATIDFDTVEIHNLHRQTLYTQNHVGQSKAIVAQTVLQQQNPLVNCVAINQKLTTNNAIDIIQDYDIVIDGSDNFTTRYLVNDTCVKLKKTLIYGSILKFEGQIAVFNHNGSKNLRHLFPEPPDPDQVPNCSVNGVLGTLPGIIGTLMAHETLKLITNLPTLHNQLLIVNTLNWKFTTLQF